MDSVIAQTDVEVLSEALADCEQDLAMARYERDHLFTQSEAVQAVFYRLCQHFAVEQRSQLVRLLLRTLKTHELVTLLLANTEADAALAQKIYRDQKKAAK